MVRVMEKPRCKKNMDDLKTGGANGSDSGSKLLQLLKHETATGPRMLTPYEIDLLKHDQLETREACRQVMLEALAGKERKAV